MRLFRGHRLPTGLDTGWWQRDRDCPYIYRRVCPALSMHSPRVLRPPECMTALPVLLHSTVSAPKAVSSFYMRYPRRSGFDQCFSASTHVQLGRSDIYTKLLTTIVDRVTQSTRPWLRRRFQCHTIP